MQCGSILTTPTGHFLPADSDGNGYFDSDLHCVWAIVAPEDMGIQFDFESVDIQPWDYPDCPEDYVEV